jgi:hypothetical protein
MFHSPETRPSLVLRLSNARDEAAWAEFLALYEPLVLRLMRRYGLQDSDSRDICQEVLAAVAKGALTPFDRNSENFDEFVWNRGLSRILGLKKETPFPRKRGVFNNFASSLRKGRLNAFCSTVSACREGLSLDGFPDGGDRRFR